MGGEVDIDLDRLTAWLGEAPVAVTRYPGGQSNPTYRVDVARGSYVLRRKPFGVLLPSAHAMQSRRLECPAGATDHHR